MLGLLLFAGCPTEPELQPAASPCVEEDRAGALRVGDVFEGAGFEGIVSELDPEAVVVGDNDWTLALSSPAGLDDCEFEVVPWMPDHGHGAGVGDVTFQSGDLRISELDFIMGGYWEVTLQVVCDGVDDEAVVALCVDP